MMNEEISSVEDIREQAVVGKETGGMFLEGPGRLDYSVESVEVLSRALDAVQADAMQGLELNVIQRVLAFFWGEAALVDFDGESVIYGCYLGEVLVRHAGWHWEEVPGEGYGLVREEDRVHPDRLVLAHLHGKQPVHKAVGPFLS